MKIEHIKGDLLKFPEGINIIIHAVNTDNVFGAGLAAQIKKQIPEMWEADCKFDIPVGPDRLGFFSRSIFARGNKEIIGYNAYTQQLGKNVMPINIPTDYIALLKSLIGIERQITKNKIKIKHFNPVIGFPYGMCCGLGGADWNMVFGFIKYVFQSTGYKIYIVKF